MQILQKSSIFEGLCNRNENSIKPLKDREVPIASSGLQSNQADKQNVTPEKQAETHENKTTTTSKPSKKKKDPAHQ